MTPVALFSPEAARGWLPWAWLSPILLIFFIAAPVIAMDGWMEAQQWSTPRGDPIGMAGLHALLWVGFAPTLLAVLAWVRFVEGRSLASIGLSGPAPMRPFVHGLAVGVAMISLLVFAIWAGGGLEVAGVGAAWRDPASLWHIGSLLPGFIFQAGTEEIIFRGWLLSVLARKSNVLVAVLLVSVVFCLMHYGPRQPPRVTASTFLFSLFACAWVLRTGNIWGAMGWHAGWNWWLATAFELPVTGIDANLPALAIALRPHGAEALTGGAEGPEGSVLCVALFLAALIAMRWWEVRRRPNPGSLPPPS
jgi:membrane protease YdiL (CAAX protease family)